MFYKKYLTFSILSFILILSNKYELNIQENFIKISYKGDYALKALIDIGIYEKKGVVSIRDISEREDIPLKFLEQIFIILKKDGLVKSKRGKEGGYRLAVSPEEITVGRILRYVEGSLKPITCFKCKNHNEEKYEEYTNCDFASACAMQNLWQKVYLSISSILDNTTLQDLINETEKLRNEFQIYQI